MERNIVEQGASFIKVLCGGEGCRNKGEKWLYYEHNGYASNGGKPVSREQLTKAEDIALRHEHQTGHIVRLVEGSLNNNVD